MNEYVITFKYDNEGYMRHIVADCEDDAVGIAFARTRGMLKEFDAKNVTSLDVKEIGKKEIRAPSRLTFNAEDGEMPVLTTGLAPGIPDRPVSRNPGQSPYPATMTPDEYSNRNLGISTAPINPDANPHWTRGQTENYQGQLNQGFNRATQDQFAQYQRQLNAAIDTVVPNNPGVYSRFVERLQQVPEWQPAPATWDAQGHPTTG